MGRKALPTLLGLSAVAVPALSQTIPNQSLDWSPCSEALNSLVTANGTVGEPLECANLNVPLDYTVEDSESLQLDLFRLPATQEPALGSVLINFGGPGGTGPDNLAVLASETRATIGEQWHLVSWDPRGTGFTIPFVCDVAAGLVDPNSPTKRDTDTIVSTNLTEVFLNGGWEAAGELADFCASSVNDTASLIGTAFVARDMAEIVNALDEDGLLRFYGWSYGTALGSYFAALFPDRVERMVLDANINPHDYQHGHYGDFAQDIDGAFAGFIDACFEVEDDCALYTLIQPNSTSDLYDALNAALAPFLQNATASAEGYQTYLGVKALLNGLPLYFPKQWYAHAESIAAVLNGTPPASGAPPAAYGEAVAAIYGIRGSDNIFIANSSDEYLPQVELQSTVSAGFSDVAYFGLWVGAQWRIPAKERYWGDFRVQTKSPILYVNGQFDPATPLAAARNGSATFNGSVLLEHTGHGHGVFVNPNDCVNQYVRNYFVNGTLPPSDEICDPDYTPAELWRAAVASAGGENGTETESGSGSAASEEANSGVGRLVASAASMFLASVIVGGSFFL